MIGRFLSPEQELRLFSIASTRPEWSVVFWVSLVTAAREDVKSRDFRLSQALAYPVVKKGSSAVIARLTSAKLALLSRLSATNGATHL